MTGLSLAGVEQLLGRELSAEQTAVVTAPLQAGAVVAGAGSGKTATMVARVVWLVGSGQVRPDQVLGLTFTSKAAAELAVRVRTALRGLRQAGVVETDGDLEPTVSTYHAYAGRLVRDHALRLGREPAARLITPASSWQLAARAVSAYDGPMDALTWAESTVIKAVLALAGDLSEHLLEPQDVRGFTAWLESVATPAMRKNGKDVLACQRVREQLLPLVETYARSKLQRDLLDFGDVVALAARLARDCPPVRESERDAFRLVLLDEYQDTGAAQEVLLSSLFGAGHAVTAVGDPCQSIYGWRGAGAGTLRRFPARFGAATPAPMHLSTNYRSGGRILQLANAVSASLRAEGVPVPELSAPPAAAAAGVVRCALLPDVEHEAGWIAEQVDQALARLAPREGARWSRAAVLCRRRSMFPRLRAAFEARGIPVEVVGLGGLLDVPEVSDVVATLRVLNDPTADAALLRLLAGSRWRIGPRDLAVLGRRARRLVRAQRPDSGDPVDAVVLGAEEEAGSLVDALDDLPPAGPDDPLSPEGRRRFELLRDELRALRRRLDQSLPDLVSDVERTLGLDVEVSARPGVASPAAARADLDAFADAAAGFAGDVAADGTGEAVLGAFLAFLDAAEDEENGLDAGAASGADTVTLMTVHAAKGLEWPVVAVPGLAAGAGSTVFPARPRVSTSWIGNPRLLPFPLRGDRSDLPVLAGLEKQDVEDHLAANLERDAREERRLGYVAFTRAEQVLLCSGYHWGEGKQPLGPSSFLLEVRTACEAGAGEVDRWVDDPPEVNPITAQERTAVWPLVAPPAADVVLASAARVRTLIAEPDGSALALSDEAAELVARWDDDIRRLAEEAAQRGRSRTVAVLPGHVSVTSLVELSRDPAALAAVLLRPLPRRPSPASRRGTAFHAWLEREVFGVPQLLDPL
ncbi:MAG: putative helicase, partial [Frankiales bacterium]|nr:putative helicase [Frankiales bacterium]